MKTLNLLERGILPDAAIRLGIRQRLAGRIRQENATPVIEKRQKLVKFVEELKALPIAIETKAANEQHYELPAKFFQYCLGKNLKYSSAYYPEGCDSLDEAEDHMLRLTCERAGLIDGDRILELGCGWGSLTLWMGKHFPKSRITGVSNSNSQREFIMGQAQERGLDNIEIITADMNVFDTDAGQFDRAVSVEMFEHMKNYQLLMQKVAKWLKPRGTLFVHIFTHREFAHHYESNDPNDFIGNHFFSGGIMPSDDLLLYFQDDLKIQDHWRVSGKHYEKTANNWLRNMDAHQTEIIPMFAETYGEEAQKWWVYWRTFYMACAELWGYANGNEWMVSHYRFAKPQ